METLKQEIFLQRALQDNKSTIGILTMPNKKIFFSMEPPTSDKRKGKYPAIPEGEYEVIKDFGGKLPAKYDKRFGGLGHKGMLEVSNVLGRNGINIHIGNKPEHSQGCILVGYSINVKEENAAKILNSKDAYLDFYFQVKRMLRRGKVFIVIYS